MFYFEKFPDSLAKKNILLVVAVKSSENVFGKFLRAGNKIC